MLQTWIHRIKPGYEGRLREWFEQLHAREQEVRESFGGAGVRAEQAFILPGVEGGLLIYVSETDNAGHASRTFDESTLAIDVEHRRVMEECLEGGLDVVPAYQMSV
jgi:hypothetical protein